MKQVILIITNIIINVISPGHSLVGPNLVAVQFIWTQELGFFGLGTFWPGDVLTAQSRGRFNLGTFWLDTLVLKVSQNLRRKITEFYWIFAGLANLLILLLLISSYIDVRRFIFRGKIYLLISSYIIFDNFVIWRCEFDVYYENANYTNLMYTRWLYTMIM